MLSTSNYKNFNTDMFSKCSISFDKDKSCEYVEKHYSLLVPKNEFIKIDDNKEYIRKYYDIILKNLDIMDVYNEIKPFTLLCSEDNMEFSHRHIVSAWLELFLDIDVPEVKIIDERIVRVDRPLWIKNYLEEVIKSDIEMYDYNSIRAAYLFKESKFLEKEANRLEGKTGLSYDDYRAAARIFKEDADRSENKYKKLNKKY